MTPIHFATPWRFLASLVVLLPVLTACGGSKDDNANATTTVAPVEELYNNGIDALNARRYETATDQFNLVEQNYPYRAGR